MESLLSILAFFALIYLGWRAYVHVFRPEQVLRERELEMARRQQKLDAWKTGLGAAQIISWFFRR